MSKRSVRQELVTAMVLLGVTSCSTPASHRLPDRFIDDPVTLPRHAGELTVGVAQGVPALGAANGQPLAIDVRAGLTSRVEWQFPGVLRWAILDERPSDGRDPDHLTLAVMAGVSNVLLGAPAAGGVLDAGLLVEKRAYARLLLSLSLDLLAPALFSPDWRVREGIVAAGAGARLQLPRRLAVGVGISVVSFQGQPLSGSTPETGIVPPPGSRLDLSTTLNLRWRVNGWVDLALFGSTGLRRRSIDPGFAAPLASTSSGAHLDRVGHVAADATVRW